MSLTYVPNFGQITQDGSLTLAVSGDYANAEYSLVLSRQTIEVLRQARTFHTGTALYRYLVRGIEMSGEPKRKRNSLDFAAVNFSFNKVLMDHEQPHYGFRSDVYPTDPNEAVDEDHLLGASAAPPYTLSRPASTEPGQRPSRPTSPGPMKMGMMDSAMPRDVTRSPGATGMSPGRLDAGRSRTTVQSPNPSDRLSRLESVLSDALARVAELEEERSNGTVATMAGEVDVIKSMLLSSRRDEILKAQVTQSMYDRMAKLETDMAARMQAIEGRVERMERCLKARRQDMSPWM